MAPAQGAAAMTAYIETFQSGNQIPYPIHGVSLVPLRPASADCAMSITLCVAAQ